LGSGFASGGGDFFDDDFFDDDFFEDEELLFLSAACAGSGCGRRARLGGRRARRSAREWVSSDVSCSNAG
jgi:hypothetical protein